MDDRAQYADDRSRWEAVLTRDPRADGLFVYAVKSTGVYCRPTCPSRRPDRKNVVFFDSADAAAEAGFRACKRCGPDDDVARDRGIVRAIRRLLDEDDENNPTLAQLGSAVHLSPSYLQRLFKDTTGLSPKEYSEAKRAGRLKEALKEGATVLDALYGAGYGSTRALYEAADRTLGMTPGAYRRGGEGVTIRYAFWDTPLGRMLIAATDRGVCALRFGEDEGMLAELRGEFPNASLTFDPQGLCEFAAQVQEHLAARHPDLDLPLDLNPTTFQCRVWKALRAIPYGETRAYHQVAESIGDPTATRAVARACASNPVALVVPCHRVNRSDGTLGGYRWGIDRKRWLLDKEGTARPK